MDSDPMSGNAVACTHCFTVFIAEIMYVPVGIGA